MDGEETLTCVEREHQREPQRLMESLPGSATLCGYPGPVVWQMAMFLRFSQPALAWKQRKDLLTW